MKRLGRTLLRRHRRVVDNYKELWCAASDRLIRAREHRCWDGKKIGHYHLRLSEGCATKLGLAVPPTFLARADELIRLLLAQSGHDLLRCKCLLMTQSG
jgi:hypothetical protein